jgi:hypothetical protein
MATKIQIDRLARRIDDLAERNASRRPAKWVQIIQQEYLGETEVDAVAKYFTNHPEQRGAGIILQVII